ncbi:2OG-Fe(II) oxygenase [Acidocella sp.]|uniref:2OG-Fe(II) oxygenase n=1 Tax=Acidocella sp. TaxID=50710 RepID=UPI0026249A0E|nr:2OG-Fe(II) oxygenase [Acidocella sp.]MDD2795553.1 2OG-Fe(II) oxygenase [Acidocella sp.]
MYDPKTAAARFLASLDASRRAEAPYRHWLLEDVLPADMCAAVAALPLAPPQIADTLGRRETHNSTRLFFGVQEQARYPVCAALAQALQSPKVTGRLEQVCGVALGGSSLRIEYCLDTDGFWLEPHTDIGAKFFTMLIYLNASPADEEWGTDVYAAPDEYAGTAPFHPNAGLIFVPGKNTWHGFRKRKITGVRRSLIVNYVTPDWRARHELAFAQTPVA